MSHTPYPPPPPSPGPGFGPPAVRPPGNGVAVAALVFGIIALVTSPIPLVNFVGLLLALVGICLGLVGLVRGRRTGRRTALAGWGLGLSVVAAGVAVVVGFLTLRYLGDWLDTVDPPEPSAEVGERFTTDDGDLEITVTSVACSPLAPDVSTAGGEECTFAFDARNRSDRTIYLDRIRVKAVIDGQWVDPSLDGGLTLAADEAGTGSGSVWLDGERLQGLAFDADDASSHSAVVVDVSKALSGQ